MKNIITLISTFILITLTSCGVSTRVTYGDISVLGYDGKAVRQWDNCAMDVTVIDHSSGQVSKTYAIRDGGSLMFTDDAGETHYISGGIIIVDNIRNTAVYTKEQKDTNYYLNLEEEYKTLKKQYYHNRNLLSKNLRGGRGPGRIEAEQYDRMKLDTENIKKRMGEIESILTDRWNEDIYYSKPDPKMEYNQLHLD